MELTPNAEGLLYVPERGKYPVIFTPNKEFTGESVRLLADTEDLRSLVAYLQKLGINRGMWRDRFQPQLMEASQVTVPRWRNGQRTASRSTNAAAWAAAASRATATGRRPP